MTHQLILAQSGQERLTVPLQSYTLLACIGLFGVLLLIIALAVAVSSGKTEANPNPGIVHRIIAPSILVPVGAATVLVPLVLTGGVMKDNDRAVEIAVARAWPAMDLPDGLTDEGDHTVRLDDRPGTACTLTVHPSDLYSWSGSLRCGDRIVPPRRSQ